MSDHQAIDFASLLLRSGLGLVMAAHGWNHIFGGGRIAGTARWFGSMGMRAPRFQAWTASIVELGAGLLLVLGLLTPFASAGSLGVMVVAWAINHRTNGFFIFRPGEGWEYVFTLAVVAIAVGTTGPGDWSIDRALGIADDLRGVPGLLITFLAGGLGAAALLGACWRPQTDPST